MTQLTQNQSFLLIEDQLDAIGQKHRVVQILRGAMLWVAWGIVAATVAALFADRVGQGPVTMGVLWLLGIWLFVSLVHWVARPLFTRPSPVAVARLIEQRVHGLHDGLTNSVLLSQSRELSLNPWMGAIYDEVLANCRTRPLDGAVKFSDLRPLGMRLLGVVAASAIVMVLAGGRVAHGWAQIVAPGTFVPKVGSVQIVDVQPGDVTLVSGQPLEVGVVAKTSMAGAPPQGRLVFDRSIPSAQLVAAAGSADGELRYSYRMDHVDASLRYRVEIGGTQSAWFTVKLVPKVSLTGLDVKIRPPAYTHLAGGQMNWSAQDTTAIAAPLGSAVEIGANIDVPMKRGVLMVGEQPPIEMTAAMSNQRFFHEMTATGDSTVFVGILSGEQIIAKLPENGVNIHAVPDAPPTIVLKSPAQDETIPPTQKLTISAELHDDYGVSGARLLVGFGSDDLQPMEGSEQKFNDARTVQPVQFALNLTAAQATHDSVVTIQVEATDNRDLTSISKDLGGQTARSQRVVIHMQDPKQIALERAQQADQLSEQIKAMIKLQQSLQEKTKNVLAAAMDRDAIGAVGKGQDNLRQMMKQAGQTDGSEIDERVRIAKKSLLLLSVNTATEAVDLASQIAAEPLAKEQARQGATLTVKQETIVSTLETLLAGLSASTDPATRPASLTTPPMPSRPDAFKNLDEALKKFEKEQQRILDQTAPLAKKAVDDFDENDKKNLDDLRMAQDKLDAFMQQTLADFSKNAQQDMSNPALVKDLMDIYTDVTMAKDALNAKSVETAVPLEETGLEGAKSLDTNMEKWMDNKPDRETFTQEDPTVKNDAPEADLPKELQDMIGKLLEQQEDLDQQEQQQNPNFQDSADKQGWNAKDGPIADNSAKGISSNVLPENNDMQGRSGSGRNAQSSGEIVGDTATDKGGRNTPTRLDPTPFQPGEVKDTSNTPAGGATGGGKKSGLGASGLEGPVPPKEEETKRLAKLQAQIRNSAEKINLQYKLGRYDNFKLLQSIVDMRRAESDLEANRYNNAMHDTDTVVDELTTSSILLGGRIQVQQDTTPAGSRRERKEIDDAAQGDLPAVWSESLREYYQKLSAQ